MMDMLVVDGDKGGVGKSFVARAVADYLLMKKTEAGGGNDLSGVRNALM